MNAKKMKKYKHANLVIEILLKTMAFKVAMDIKLILCRKL
jgi:hypothetical protein